MNLSILEKIPKKYYKAIIDIYYDDGYWCYIGNGYMLENYYSKYTIHEDSFLQFRQIFKHIIKE